MQDHYSTSVFNQEAWLGTWYDTFNGGTHKYSLEEYGKILIVVRSPVDSFHCIATSEGGGEFTLDDGGMYKVRVTLRHRTSPLYSYIVAYVDDDVFILSRTSKIPAEYEAILRDYL